MIGIFAALRRELRPIAALLLDREEFTEAGVRFSTGHLNQRTVVLIQTGIGCGRAASAAQMAAARFPLKLYISTGFAGALQESIQVGDLVIGQKVLSLASIYPASIASERGRLHPAPSASEDRALPVRARGVGASEERSPHGPPQIMAATQAPIIDQKVFVCNEDLARLSGSVIQAFPRSIFLGPLITVDRMVGRVEEKRAIANRSGAIALDMETAAVADLAERRRTPFMAVRAVTDRLEEELGLDGDQFLSEAGTFRWFRGIRYLLGHPAALSHLNRLRRQSNFAAESLGLFFQKFLPSLSVN